MRQGAPQESEAAHVSEGSFRSANIMSALPSKADMCGAARDVRFGPIADIAERHGEMPCKISIRQSRFSQALGIPGKILRPAKRNLILQIRNTGRRIELA
jgi:hypothetical protein